jgi:hypothetical protein
MAGLPLAIAPATLFGVASADDFRAVDPPRDVPPASRISLVIAGV